MKYFSVTLDFDNSEITWEIKPESNLMFTPLPSRLSVILLIVGAVVLLLILITILAVKLYQRKKRQDLEKIEQLYMESMKPSLKMMGAVNLINASHVVPSGRNTNIEEDEVMMSEHMTTSDECYQPYAGPNMSLGRDSQIHGYPHNNKTFNRDTVTEKSFKQPNSLITSVDYLGVIGIKNYAEVKLETIPEDQEQFKSTDKDTVIKVLGTDEGQKLTESDQQ